jgi:hypothetical protein
VRFPTRSIVALQISARSTRFARRGPGKARQAKLHLYGVLITPSKLDSAECITPSKLKICSRNMRQWGRRDAVVRSRVASALSPAGHGTVKIFLERSSGYARVELVWWNERPRFYTNVRAVEAACLEEDRHNRGRQRKRHYSAWTSAQASAYPHPIV